MIKKLSGILPGNFASVVDINCGNDMKRRLHDIGLVPGTIVKAVHSSPSGNPRAYLIRGAVIALRNDDAEMITVDEHEAL